MFLRNSGELFINIKKTHNWIDKNIDTLFANYKKNQHKYRKVDFFDPPTLKQRIQMQTLVTEGEKLG